MSNVTPIRPAVGMSRMDQLRAFVDFEKASAPGKTHIAAWALQEIERLRADGLKTSCPQLISELGYLADQFECHAASRGIDQIEAAGRAMRAAKHELERLVGRRIDLGEKLFEFLSKQDWINKANRIWRYHGVTASQTICVDQLGRICGWGKHFADAERDNAYPIEVFRLRQDMTPAGDEPTLARREGD